MTTLLSWNVNGLRACYGKGALAHLITTHTPDVLFLQETKLQLHQVPPELEHPYGYHAVYACAEKKGYSGVALYTKKAPLQVFTSLNSPQFDAEGRIVGAEFDTYIAFGVYFPNGQQSPQRLRYKLDFYDAFFTYCHSLAVHYQKPLFVAGDFNTAHTAIDLARPKENEQISGFLPIERAWLDRLINEFGYIDTFRMFEQAGSHYSWWSYRGGARSRNVGWRIDYVFASRLAQQRVTDGFILPAITGSDHCPVGVTFTP